MTEQTPTELAELLHLNAVDSTPVDVESWTDALGYGEDGEERADYWQGFTFEGSDGESYSLVAHGSTVAGVYLDGFLYESWDDYAADCEGEDRAPVVAEDLFTELLDVEPYVYGAEGPMMNYWYPLGDDLSDPATAAAELDTCLCVVEVDGAYGLALTGGGMDLSWEICGAFIRLGYLPPTHFSDLPKMAGHDGDALTVAAMRRALTIRLERAGWALDRLNREYPADVAR